MWRTSHDASRLASHNGGTSGRCPCARRGRTVTHGHEDHDRWTPDGPMSAEAALALDAEDDDAQRTLLDLAVTAAGIGTFDWDLPTGTLSFDERLVDLFGYDQDGFDRTIEGFNARLHPEDLAPVTVFAKGVWHSMPELQATGASALGIDWGNTPQMARQLTGNSITLQGNYDPVKLLQPIKKIQEDVKQMINEFGPQRYIANLGHGIIPSIPVEHAKAFVTAVKEWKS